MQLRKSAIISDDPAPSSLRHQSSKMLVPQGVGEILLSMSKSFSELLSIENLSIDMLKTTVIQICKSLTGASWIEVLFRECDYLTVSGKSQPVSELKINETSFPGYCALHKTPQAINNPNSSSFYSSFEHKLYPYSNLGNQQMQANSVACVPIVKNENTKIVLLLFNKLDENKSMSYFSENDMNIIQAIGEMMLGVLEIINHCKDLQTKNFDLKRLDEETIHVTNCTSNMLVRRKLLEKCIQIIDEEGALTNSIVKLIGEIMEGDGVIVHVLKSNALSPALVWGLNDITTSTKTAEYTGMVVKEILNVNDLATEPLWDKEKKIKMRGLISCPVFNENNEVISVIEFFRKNKPFSSIDEKFVKQLIKAVEKVHPDRYITNITEKKPPNLSKPHERAIDARIREIRLFSFNQDDLYNYASVLEEIRTSLRQLVSSEWSSVYIADQKGEFLWTRQSEECDTLTQLMSKDTLLGYVYHHQKTVVFPNEIQLSDSSRFNDQFAVCAPIISEFSDYPVIGIVLLTRIHNAFSLHEIETLQSFCTKIASNFENIYLYSVESQTVVCEWPESVDMTPEENFRRANSRANSKSRQQQHHGRQEFHALSPASPSIQTMPHSMNDLCSLSMVPQNRTFELKQILSDIKHNPEASLTILARRLRQIIPCQNARLLLMDQTEQHLVDVISGSLMKPSGLLNQCLQRRQVIAIRSGASLNPNFDKHVDSLGIDQPIENFLAIPIQSILDHPLGILAFANASISFGEDDLAIAQFLSLIPREFAMVKDESLKDYHSVLRMGRRHKMLQQWCKQVFFVANSAQNKMAIAKDILHTLFEEEKLDVLIKSGLEIICALTNAEEASVVYKESNEFVEGLLERGRYNKSTLIEEEHLVMKALDVGRSLSIDSQISKENMIIVPYVQERCDVVALKAWNKRDDSLSYYCNFNKEDEIIIYSFAGAISEALQIFHNDSSTECLNKLKQLIRQHASNLNTYSLLSTIRSASQRLLDCDRATMFIREGKCMVIKAQGLEQEIPVGFSIPIGKGIIGNVAQTGQTENIKDVYADPRFNPEVDRSTGYKTSTMLCMPVLDPQGDVIAALQMINKRKGYFDSSDEETLEIFCEIISTVLQNWNLFQHQIEERSRFLNILNSIGNYILVLNTEGMLEYCNKSFESLFGVPEKIARKSHYSSWLRQNRQLVYDITSIYQKTSKRIHRASQKILSIPIKRTRTLPNLRSFSLLDSKDMVVNYTIAALQDFFNLDSSGIVLIFEDATAIEELNMKFLKMQNELLALKNPVYSETSLQRCIQKLGLIASASSMDSDNSQQIYEIVKTLKEGNLNRAEVTFPADLQTLSAEIKQGLKAYAGLEEVTETPRLPTPTSRSQRAKSDFLTVNIEELRDIDINMFEVENHFQYVFSMLEDFDLINQFNIPQDKLENFVGDVKEHYEIYMNPFHNFNHGMNVMHASYLLLASTAGASFFGPLEIFSFFIAALCHDVEHTGKTNAFEMNRESHLAIIYNDKSVLENHHAAMTFKLLQSDRNNIIQSLTPDFRKTFRKLVIVSILGTDMVKHFPMISNMNARFKDMHENPLGTRDSDIDDVAAFLLHCADLAHPCKRTDVYQMWSQKVCEEFTRQYEEEVRIGLPPTEIMKDLHKPEVYYSNELGFLKFVIKPLWECANLWLHPHIDKMLENLNGNIDFYQKRKEEYEKHDK
ncbi:unnamed protein product [Blepharisma stoltei]|uniref:Phosphodiesterase n=1 Tax=Blepharisma stoltei TaxID=1481888 RepID=A0AAU9JEI8_9CILI|nr:unnamed protein product [Blepharisma stoltei]